MTNTYMLPGEHTPEEIIASVKKGIYAPNFGGGQVDITSGKFVFSASEAYLIENGKITRPIKGATLIGSGIEACSRYLWSVTIWRWIVVLACVVKPDKACLWALASQL